jgi:prophage regulatory protein
MSDVNAAVMIPETGYLRLRQILGDPRAIPPIPAIIPVGKSTWWKWVKDGKAPAAIKIGPRITVWRAEDVRDFVESYGKKY